MTETRLFLSPSIFAEREHTLVEHGVLVATAFHYDSGVAALRIENDRGALVLLPYQGQQIWSAHFNGRELTMRSMFEQPYPTRDFLRTFGGFFQHCGLTSGAGTGDNSAGGYGELPNAPYDKAWLIAGEDDLGMFLELGGEYRHTRAFTCDYVAQPRVRLYAGRATFAAYLHVSNLMRSPMDLAYTAHINFRPVDNGWLVYSARYDRDHIRVRTDMPEHSKKSAAAREFLQELAEEPEKHHVMAPNLSFDPPVTLYVDYQTDPDGFAHSLQIHTDGASDYVRHRPDQLPCGMRWIYRSPDYDALGLVLPSTAAEPGKGSPFVLGAGEVWECETVMGALTVEETRRVRAVIEQIQET